MILIHIETHTWPVTIDEFKQLHPSVGLPINEDVLAKVDFSEYGYAVVEETSPPKHDPLRESCVPTVTLVGDRHIMAWVVVALSPVQIAEAFVSVPPVTVTPWQIRKALNLLGLRESVEAAVASADQMTQDAWQYATEIVRTDPLVASIAGALGKSSAEIDALFDVAKAN